MTSAPPAAFPSLSGEGPSVNLIEAVDAPFTFLKQHFWDYAPTVLVGVLFGVLPALPSAFLATYLQNINPNDPASLALLPLAYIAPCFTYIGMALGYALEAACIANILAGRGGGLGEAAELLASVRFWVGYTAAALLNGIGYAFCCFGGFLLVLPFGLIMPAVLEEKLGLEAINRSITLSLQKTGPELFDRPGWKAVAVLIVGTAVSIAFSQAVTLPIYLSMGNQLFEAIQSGNLQMLEQAGMVDPWVSITVSLLAVPGRVLTDTYGIAGMLLIFRDARARLDGADLERALEEPEAPRA